MIENDSKLEEQDKLRDGKRIVQVRSEAGRLLLIKTEKGYEFKCPRSKKVYLISYAQMIMEYLTWWDKD